MDFMKPETVLDLDNIRQALQRMEDSIIFNFIERSQFYTCPSVYKADVFPIPNFKGSFLDWLLSQHEAIQSQVRRYEAPDEYPFFPDALLPTFLPKINYPPILASYANDININNTIKKIYIETIVPGVSIGDADQMVNLGSTAMTDIDALQSLSRRIHFGMFVAEAKFRSERERFTKLIRENDVKGIEDAITNKVVEDKILLRLLEKGKAYGVDPTLKFTQHIEGKVKPEVIVNIYRDYVIPLTKKVEVDYLLRRLDVEDP
ncbi:DEKNAAC104946 [Brettanomyces naardenensis]|uniref:Chorismate mutase n=1 Tax=Brettanomyces naardenensis TaxID=13370 RepID=A0A448YRU5_BRENA|nr:DEKNAAC104946 [Brettanomyces naardenensis]